MATKKVFSSTSLGIPQRQKMLNKNTHTKWMMEYNEKIKDHTAADPTSFRIQNL